MPTIHRGSSMTPKLRGGCKIPSVGERSDQRRRCTERSTGAIGRDSASISSDKPGENPGRRKTKDS